MKRSLYVLFTLVFVFGILADEVHAVPKFLNYQGKLSDATGAPVANGTYQITFSIYDGPTGGTQLWTETLNVPVNNGVFAVELGKVTPVPSTLITVPSLFLGIKVGSDPEMTPRSPLHPVPKAFLSEKAEDALALEGKPLSDFVLKIDPKWGVLSDQDGAVNNADTQHTHSFSVSGMVQLAPGTIQTDASNNPSIFINKTGTGPLLQLQNSGSDKFVVSNSGDVTLGNLNVLGSLNLGASATSPFVKLADPKWNVVTNQDGVVDNADAMHSHSGGGGGGAAVGTVLLNPTGPQTIQPSVDATPLELKSGTAAPFADMFKISDFAGIPLVEVTSSGDLLVGNPGTFAKLSVESNTGNPVLAVKNLGSSIALDTWHAGGLGSAGVFSITNPFNSSGVIEGSTDGTGSALEVFINNPGNGAPLIYGDSSGTGNLLQLALGGIDKFVVDKTGTITVGGASDPNAVKTNPSAIQTIQPTLDTVPLALKPGVGAPTADLFSISNFTDIPLIQVNPSGNLLVGNPAITAKVSVLETGTTNDAGYFQINNATNSGNAVYGKTNGTGTAGQFEIVNATNADNAVSGWTNGTGSTAYFEISNGTNANNAVYATTNGTGDTLYANTTGDGSAGYFNVNNAFNSTPVLYSVTNGLGATVSLEINNAINGNPLVFGNIVSGSGNLLQLQQASSNKFVVDNTGNVTANGSITAFNGTNSTLVSSSGTQQIIQSGNTCETVMTDGSVTVTFPSAFAATPFVTFGQTSGAAAVSPTITAKNATAFSVGGFETSVSIECVDWIAIGNKN